MIFPPWTDCLKGPMANVSHHMCFSTRKTFNIFVWKRSIVKVLWFMKWYLFHLSLLILSISFALPKAHNPMNRIIFEVAWSWRCRGMTVFGAHSGEENVFFIYIEISHRSIPPNEIGIICSVMRTGTGTASVLEIRPSSSLIYIHTTRNIYTLLVSVLIICHNPRKSLHRANILQTRCKMCI